MKDPDVSRAPTQDELLARIAERRPADPFGFELGDYAVFLDAAHAATLGLDVASEPWVTEPWSRDALLVQMRDYLAFAFGKANDQRGLSANRSVMHFVAWTWLAGDRGLSAEIERMFREEYRYYGKLILRRVADHYGWPWAALDDGVLSNGG